MQTFFRGKIREMTRHGENHNEAVQYGAYGQSLLADEVFVKTTYVSSVTTVVGTYEQNTLSVKGAVQRLFTEYGSELTARGISATYDDATLPNIPVEQTLDLQGGFLQSLRQVISYDPAATVHFDDLRNRWTFPRPEQSPKMTVDVSAFNLQTHDVKESTANRFTAIVLTAPEGSN